MTQNHADIVKCAEQIVNGDSYHPLLNTVTGYFEIKEYMESLIMHQFIATLHVSLYQRTLLDEDIFNLDRRYKLGEDIYMNVVLANKCRAAFVSNDYNNSSAMQTKVMSFEYHERIGQLIHNAIKNTTPSIESHFKYGRIRNIIHCFFVPEIAFSEERYIQLKEELSKEDVRSYVQKNIEVRYIRFVQIQWIFKLYTIFYRYVCLIWHQHGIKKDLIY